MMKWAFWRGLSFDVSRWWTLAFSALMEICAGIIYVVGVYSLGIKQRFKLSQGSVQTMSIMLNTGSGIGIPAGLSYDLAGPKFTIIVGCILMLAGYGGIYLTASGMMNQSFEALCLFTFIAGFSNTWIDNCVVCTNAKNFPRHRGVVIGLLSSLVGLSCSINTQIYFTFFDPNWMTFLLFIAIGLSAIVLVSVPFINVPKFSNELDRFEGWPSRRLVLLEVTMIAMAGYLQAASTLENIYDLSFGFRLLLTIGMMGIFSVFFVVPFLWRNHQRERMLDSDEGGDGDNGPREDNASVLTEESAATDAGESGKTVKQAVLDINFWLVCCSITAGSGAGVMVFNNIGQVVESLGGAPGSEDAFVSALGIASCLGRLGIGVISSKLEGKVARPWLYFVGMVLMALSHAALGFSSLNTLYLGCIGSGIALGAFYSITPTMVADLFGLKYMGTILGLIMVTPEVGSWMLSRFLASWVYEAHAAEGSIKCIGQSCFQLAFLINSAVCGVASLLAFVLCHTSKNIYKALYSHHEHEHEQHKEYEVELKVVPPIMDKKSEL